jgi:uncharacterized protein YabN with tetrapyrrole methylase and pyrophosphatase domain
MRKDKKEMEMHSGSLTIVGTGIRLIGHCTIEARTYLEQADKVLYLVADPVTTRWIESLNPTAESLHSFYEQGKDRRASYFAMVERILSEVRRGLKVCAAFYGHPGVFVNPSHEAIRQARVEGFDARMLPGISAEDCLFADLGLDPASCGCQSFEATDFLVYKRQFDTRSALILWQIGIIGDLTYNRSPNTARGLQVLTERLLQFYDPKHNTIIYQASMYPICDSVLESVPLERLPETPATQMSTLYVPPKSLSIPDPQVLQQLGIELPSKPTVRSGFTKPDDKLLRAEEAI